MDVTGPLAEYDATVPTAAALGVETVGRSHTDSKIPLELFSRIIDHIDDSHTITLLSMLVLSKFVCSEVERKLCHSIRFKSSRGHTLFLESILDPKRAHLVRCVHQYSLYQAPVSDDYFNNLLTRALAIFVNLKHLSFAESHGLASAKVLPTKIPCPFQLHTFRWLRGNDDSYLGPFLDGQHSLEVLWMFLKPENFSVSSTSLQRLRNLSGSIEVILEILQSRKNITRLHWEPLSPTLPVDISLFPSFSHVRILSFGAIGKRPTLGVIISLLEHLEILELGRIYESELVDLYKLARLRTLVISYRGTGRHSVINPRDAFQEMQHLESIALASGLFERSGRVHMAYQRWSRNAPEPVEVDSSEAVWWNYDIGRGVTRRTV